MQRLFSGSLNTRKHKGTAVLAVLMVSAVVGTMVAVSMAKVTQASTSSLSSNKISLQAQHYAAAKADLIEAKNYGDLSAQSKTAISDTGFSDEVIVGAESIYPADAKIKQKQCTINVYKGSEPLPRSTIHFTKYSATSSDLNIGEAEWLGSGSRTFVAKEAGFVTAGGSNKPQPLVVKVNGKTLGYVCPRGYGTGTISACVPVPKGATVSLSGQVDWAYWSKLKA